MPPSEYSEIHSSDATVTPPIQELDTLALNSEVSCASPFSFFENLPAELRDNVLLHIPDLPTLRSLVRASPIMHAQYRSNRNTILRACLGRELDGCFIDAYACVKSRPHEMLPRRTDEKITAFLAGYHTWLSGSRPPPDINSLEPDLCVWLAAFHVSVIRPLGRHYAAWALENLKRAGVASLGGQEVVVEAGAETAPDWQLTLSRSEEIRVFRALYKYELYCNLFGRNECDRSGGLLEEEINEIFTVLFEPWEVEAIGCIDLFMRDKYTHIFKEVEWDLSDQNPKFRQPDGLVNPSGAFWLDIEWDDYMDGTISRGLAMITSILAVVELRDHQALVEKMEDCLTHDQCLDASLNRLLWGANQILRREETHLVNARDEAEWRRDPMTFGGDVVPPDGPPLGWVLLWSGIYANIFGEHTPASVKDWGYVIWDERRWNELGAKDLVVKQWETEPNLANNIEVHWGWRPGGGKLG